MKIWLVTIGEALPLLGVDNRLQRTGSFARYLAKKGHEVTLWTSTFDHFSRRALWQNDVEINVQGNLKIRALHGPGYLGTVSLGRIIHQYVVAKRFCKELSLATSMPDVIVTAFPTIELAAASVRWGHKQGVPVIVDVRDLWPDIFVRVFPSFLKPLASILINRIYPHVPEVFRNSSGLIAVSHSYLHWALNKAGMQKRQFDAVFPLGCEENHVSANALTDYEKKKLSGMGVGPDRFICWFLGTFGKSYDLSPILCAAKVLEKDRPEVQFVVSGGGDREKEWRKLAEGLSNVVFTGWLNSTDIGIIGRAAKVGLAAYSKGAPQSLPNKIFEYLSFGLPIISSLSGEAQSLLATHQCGFTYNTDNPAQVVAGIVELAGNSNVWGNMADSARQVFDREYSPGVLHAKMESYLEVIVASRNSHG